MDTGWVDQHTASHMVVGWDSQAHPVANILPEVLVGRELDKVLGKTSSLRVGPQAAESGFRNGVAAEIVSWYTHSQGFCEAMPVIRPWEMERGSSWQIYYRFLPSPPGPDL